MLSFSNSDWWCSLTSWITFSMSFRLVLKCWLQFGAVLLAHLSGLLSLSVGMSVCSLFLFLIFLYGIFPRYSRAHFYGKLVFFWTFAVRLTSACSLFCSWVVVKALVACSLEFSDQVSSPSGPFLSFVPVIQLLLRFIPHAAASPQCGARRQIRALESRRFWSFRELSCPGPRPSSGWSAAPTGTDEALVPRGAAHRWWLNLELPRRQRRWRSSPAGTCLHLPELPCERL